MTADENMDPLKTIETVLNVGSLLEDLKQKYQQQTIRFIINLSIECMTMIAPMTGTGKWKKSIVTDIACCDIISLQGKM